ncbi:UNVERIFIED_CONTAM: hypothetical protein Sradi_1693400 [Sesamum radiatum]|uniref:Uncharacterized protein n=1 Tax=Sesamum radiatum TaxID=300843 RepID=A0AAW2UF33_SESRA
MRFKSWPWYSTWTKIFGEDRAQGDRGKDSHAYVAQVRAQEQRTTQDCYTPTAEWNPETGFVAPQEDPPLGLNTNDDPTLNSSSASKRTGSSS